MNLHFDQCPELSIRPGINEAFSDASQMERYVEHFQRPGREIFEQRQMIVEHCQLHPEMVVADLGVGSGVFAELIAPRVKKLFAIDVFRHFVDFVISSDWAKQNGNVEGVTCGPDSIGLSAQTIDLVLICNTYHHLEFPKRMVESIHQALRPAGAIVLVDIHPEPDDESGGQTAHVRGSRATFRAEIESVGFYCQEPVNEFLEKAYLDRFIKRD